MCDIITKLLFIQHGQIMSSSIGSRLAVRRWTQYALSRPGELERFLPGPEASLVRQVIPEQWALIGLGEEEKYTVQEARELFEMNPEEFVAKNILRPRTGSGKTQDRMDSGGMIVDSADAIRRLLTIESDGRPKGRNYILYRKIHGRRHDAVLAHESDLHRLDHGLAVSEVATYGAYLSLAGQENSAIIVNCLAGLGARTRVCSRDHPIAQVLGYGAVSGVCLAA
jgi:hypothetical protein